MIRRGEGGWVDVRRAIRRCWQMRALRDGARPQGDRKGSPLLYTAWGADPSVYSRGGACPRPDRSPMGFNLRRGPRMLMGFLFD